jgi:hypothetical protein
MVEFFQTDGTTQSLTDQENNCVKTKDNCSAQNLKIRPQTLSGPQAFLMLRCLKRDKTALSSTSVIT